jgi:hypothetical protein
VLPERAVIALVTQLLDADNCTGGGHAPADEPPDELELPPDEEPDELLELPPDEELDELLELPLDEDPDELLDLPPDEELDELPLEEPDELPDLPPDEELDELDMPPDEELDELPELPLDDPDELFVLPLEEELDDPLPLEEVAATEVVIASPPQAVRSDAGRIKDRSKWANVREQLWLRRYVIGSALLLIFLTLI